MLQTVNILSTNGQTDIVKPVNPFNFVERGYKNQKQQIPSVHIGRFH